MEDLVVCKLLLPSLLWAESYLFEKGESLILLISREGEKSVGSLDVSLDAGHALSRHLITRSTLATNTPWHTKPRQGTLTES